MKFRNHLPAAGLLMGCVAFFTPLSAHAQAFSPDQRQQIEQIVKDYLMTHPELLQDVMGELEKRQSLAEAEKHRATIKEQSATLFNSPRQVTLGNPQGDVTVVEFFDYNCGYCKRAMSEAKCGRSSGQLRSLLARRRLCFHFPGEVPIKR